MPFENILHVFGPYAWHGETFILGDRPGLVALRDALNQAIESEVGVGVFKSMTNDGEGFDGAIARINPEDIARMAVPYTDEIAQERRDADKLIWGSNLRRVRDALKAQREVEEARYAKEKAEKLAQRIASPDKVDVRQIEGSD